MPNKNLLRTASIVSVLALTLALSGSASAKDKDKDKQVAPPAKSIRVAIMPIVNGSPDVSAPKIMEDVLRDRFRDMPAERATFLQPADTQRLLENHDALGRAFAISDRWSKYGTIDSTAAAGLDSVLSADAILLVKVAEWENLRVNVIGQGESNTTVGLQFALFDLRSLRKSWFKNPREQRFVQEVDPSSGAVNYDETGYIQSRKVTDPPRYEDVASDLTRTAFKNFPQR